LKSDTAKKICLSCHHQISPNTVIKVAPSCRHQSDRIIEKKRCFAYYFGEVIDTRASEAIAMAVVMETERALGNKPKVVSDQRGIGYDIESESGADGRLRFIEVKGRRKGASDVTLTKNELTTALKSTEQFILALVEIDGEQATQVRYLHGYDFKEPKAAQFNLKQLLAESSAPRLADPHCLNPPLIWGDTR